MVRIESCHRSGEGATKKHTRRYSYTVRVLALTALKRIQSIDLKLYWQGIDEFFTHSPTKTTNLDLISNMESSSNSADETNQSGKNSPTNENSTQRDNEKRFNRLHDEPQDRRDFSSSNYNDEKTMF